MTEVEACLQLEVEPLLVVRRVPSVNGFALEAGLDGGPVKYQMFTVGESVFLAFRSSPLVKWGRSIKLAAEITPTIGCYADLARFAHKFFTLSR